MSSARRILAVDVGTGTQDILVYDPARPMENCEQLVLPSPTVLVAHQIRQATAARRPVHLVGPLMGGGPCVRAVREHLAAGLAVFATSSAARTIRDNLDEVRALGVQIKEEPVEGAQVVRTGDVDPPLLREVLGRFAVALPEEWAVAVQDHGECLQGSNREVRFRFWRDFVAGGGDLKALAFREPPPLFTRMRAVQEIVPGAVVMDTAAAAVWGALADEEVAARAEEEGAIIVNLGNGHTLGALVQGERLWGLFEHHTRLMTGERISAYLSALRSGTLRDEEVRAEGGHGAYIHPAFSAGEKAFRFVAVTGPQRHLVKGCGFYLAAPYGNMMLTGCFGLLRASSRCAEFGR
ncbi:MAG: DUF1786 domain-containing protein [Bacillota bacterium]|nr:DUF1786 domain-containing protein [Bacillota bacterium]